MRIESWTNQPGQAVNFHGGLKENEAAEKIPDNESAEQATSMRAPLPAYQGILVDTSA